MEVRPEDLDRSWLCRWRCCSRSLQYLPRALQTAVSGLLDLTRVNKKENVRQYTKQTDGILVFTDRAQMVTVACLQNV